MLLKEAQDTTDFDIDRLVDDAYKAKNMNSGKLKSRKPAVTINNFLKNAANV